MIDARIATAFPTHPKTKKLQRRLGDAGPLRCLYLFLWAAANRSNGDLSGLSDEDIELAVDWGGHLGVFVEALVDIGFLDGQEGARQLHDWMDWNPWASGSEMRSAKAKWNAIKRHHGVYEANRQVPEWAMVLNAASNADSNANSKENELNSNATSIAASKEPALLDAESSNAPSPSPSPSPSPKKLMSADPPADLCPHVEIISAYHELLPELTRVRTWEPDRQALLRARWREAPERQNLTWWREFFEYVRRCPFLLGQEISGHRDPFLADLEWLIRPRNFRKVIEGKYESRKSA